MFLFLSCYTSLSYKSKSIHKSQNIYQFFTCSCYTIYLKKRERKRERKVEREREREREREKERERERYRTYNVSSEYEPALFG